MIGRLFLLRNSRTTDSPAAAKSVEFLHRLAPRVAACALLSAIAPAAVFAQLHLFTFDGSVEKPVIGITELGIVPASDSSELRFRARNSGPAPVTLTSVALAGQGFTVTSSPSLPFVVASLNSNFAEIRVRFSATDTGSYSATFAANSIQTILHATVVPSATISVVNDIVATLLASGATLDFGRVQRGKSATLDVRVANGTNAGLTLQSCTVSGAAFSVLRPLACPLSLAAGASIIVTVAFNPSAVGNQSGALLFDGRSFTLSGVGFDPPLPKPSIVFDAPLSSGTQQRLSIHLSAAPESSGSGTVAMSFQPASGAGDDSAIRFTGSGARILSFQVKEGDPAPVFPTGVDTVFQTGTTAGNITFRVTLGNYDEQFQFPVAAAPIFVDLATATRRVSDLDVSIRGFDNTHTAGQFSFTFFDTSGHQVQPGAVRADWSSAFGNYFRSSALGGSFLMRATFPVSGDASQIAGVEVEMTNSAGTTRTTRFTF